MAHAVRIIRECRKQRIKTFQTRLTVRPVRLALIWPQTDLFNQMFDISKKRERFKWMKSMKKEKKEKKKKEPPSKLSGVHEPRQARGNF